MQKHRPKYLDIPKIYFPVPSIVSILHRISGVGLFLFLPLLLWLFAGTLSSESSFATYQAVVANPLVKLILIGLLWAYLHHAFAGIRFLLLDADKGLDLAPARLSANVVVYAAPIVALIVGVCLW
ncbi:MAG: succinate dehydrogenase, cytochrome b556 subunit [Neisseria sp.]|nr:succinate dehydrogenase, cytochrome b556 subunit [Neisseria sp.]